MYENDWKTEEPTEPWEQRTYRTGKTSPPKNRRGLVAVLLVIVIFLGGIVSALSLLNIRLFQKLRKDTDTPEPSFWLSDGETEAVSSQDASAPTRQHGSMELQLEPTPASVENIPQAGGLSLQKIYEGAISSVVSISCTTTGGSASGTGVILSDNGYIVTNCHVVEDAVQLQVLLQDGSKLPASIIGLDAVSDLAVLQISAQNLTPAKFGDSSALRVGDAVVAIGDPLGAELRGTMTDGIVSAINRDITTGGRTMTLIQTNAALNSGNSGGPLLNCYGQVIGINTMKIGDYMNDAGVEGLGFAIPSTTVKEIVDQLIAQGYVSGRPSLGFTGQTVTAFDRLYYGIPQGVCITSVKEDSDASAKGLTPGDILLQLNGIRISDLDSLQTLLYSLNAGDTVEAVIYRSGRQYRVSITLEQSQ